MRTRRIPRSLALIGAAVIGLTLAPSTAQAQTETTQGSTSARYGAGYLAREITEGRLGTPQVPAITNVASAVLALHAAGVGRDAAKKATDFLATRVADLADNPGRLGYTVLAAVAEGRNPRRFGGADLVAQLVATQRTTGTDAGLFGAAAPTFDGAFRQGVALAALKAAKVPSSDPAVAKGLGWLTAQQCENGLWQAYRADVSVACPAADPATFAGPDTNSSSLAVQGLAAYGKYPKRAKVLASLEAARSADGGFSYLAAPGQESDPNSTALTIQAFLAEGASPGAAYQVLAGYQLGCGDLVADRGAYFYPGSRAANLIATVQAVPAAAGKTLPLKASVPSSVVPVMPCDSGATTLATQAGTPGPCAGTSGVTVSVDFVAFGGAQETRCAPGAQATGVAALQNAGFTLTGTDEFGLAFICRINNLPAPAQETCASTPSATAYWSYYHANVGATAWTYSTRGASTYKPQLGSIEAWAFGDSAGPTKTPAQVRSGT